MRRRTFVKSMAAAMALQPMPWANVLGSPAHEGIRIRVHPSNSAWPDAARWQELRDAVGGNLITVEPLFGACTADPKGAGCKDVLKNIRNPFFIGDQPAGTETSAWLDAWTTAPSVYAVKARNAADVAAGVNFARDHNLRLVVKGGGHSYLGTSNAPDSLLIWTRAMNAVELHDAFVGQGCEGTVDPTPAVSAGAGAMWIDLYHRVTTEAGRYVQGGGCTSVGVAGLVQSGGFGSFSKGFGTAASGLLEAEIVTADGTVQIANACTNPDLFWALKGGGGGSWGVVTRLTLRTHVLPKNFGAAWGKIKAQSDDAFRRLLSRFFTFYASDLLNPHWGEQVSITPDNSFKISMVCQGLDNEEAKAMWKPFFDWVHSLPNDFAVVEPLGVGAEAAQHWWDVDGNDSMIRDLRPGAPAYHGWWRDDAEQVGVFLHGYDSLWLPASLLNENARFVDALFAGSRFKSIGLHLNKGLAGAPGEAVAATRATATNPIVTEAFALAIIAGGDAPVYPGMPRAPVDYDAAHKKARLIDLATAELRKVVPNAGSYVSESNFFNESWQTAYWGGNYRRLRAIKDKYDPDGLFIVHHGVGSEGWSPDGFARLA